MTGKGHLWSGSVTLISMSVFDRLVVYPKVVEWIDKLNESSVRDNIIVDFAIEHFTKFNNYFVDMNFVKVLIILVFLCCFYFGLLLPDIDSPGSTISKILHFNIPVNHRALHTIYFVVLFTVLGFSLNYVFLFIAYGYFVHLLYDCLSVAGVCWLYPIGKHNVYKGVIINKNPHLKLYHTGEASEIVVNIFVTLIAITFVVIIIILKGGSINV